jgi:hypothetical protein
MMATNPWPRRRPLQVLARSCYGRLRGRETDATPRDPAPSAGLYCEARLRARRCGERASCSPLFHVSHSLCRPFSGVCRGRGKKKIHPFPQPNHPPSPHARIFFGRVCYFLRKLTLKPAEKEIAKSTWKRCAKRVENALIFCGLPLASLCKTLRITCGDRVESQRRTHRNPVYFLWTKSLILRILTLPVVFLSNTTTTSCGPRLDIRFHGA